MAASSWRTWQDRTPGFKIMDRGADSLARVLDMAIQSKSDREETSAGAFGYEEGSPQKAKSRRFGGDVFLTEGEFGSITNDRNNKPAQDSLMMWAGQWSSGPFGLGVPGAPPSEGEQPPMNA